MSQDDIFNDAHIDTLAVRAGQERGPEGEHAEALFLTSSYVFESAAASALEGAEQAVATSSGMAAILSTAMALLKAGDHVVCSRSVFGTTTVLFNKFMQKFGVEVTFVPLTDLQAWQQAVRENTAMLFLETPSNPLCEVADMSALAKLARDSEALLVVDNCFCTPALQRPLELGADIVVHSATKYLEGQGRCVGGVVLGRQ